MVNEKIQAAGEAQLTLLSGGSPMPGPEKGLTFMVL